MRKKLSKATTPSKKGETAICSGTDEYEYESQRSGGQLHGFSAALRPASNSSLKFVNFVVVDVNYR